MSETAPTLFKRRDMRWIDNVNAQCPLRILRSVWEDPTLVVGGDGWNLACTSTWRLMTSDRMIVGSQDEGAEDVVSSLKGHSIERCSTPTGSMSGDARFELDDGTLLEVFVASMVDPWVLRLPAGPTIVPSPGDPDWFGASSTQADV